MPKMLSSLQNGKLQLLSPFTKVIERMKLLFRAADLLPFACFWKNLNKIITTRLNHWIVKGFSTNQFGFWKGCSVENTILNATDKICSANSKFKWTVAISLDIRRAFDNALWPAVLNYIYDHQCPHNLFRLICDYFSDRKAVICYSCYQYT